MLKKQMPPKKSSEDGAATALTDAEARMLKAVFENMVQKPDADWNNVAATMNLKDAKCAKERFRQMSSRHGWSSSPKKPAAAGVGVDSKVSKPRTPTKKPKVAKKKAESEDELCKSETE